MLQMDISQINAFLHQEFPQAVRFGFVLEHLEENLLRLRLPVQDRHLRPGGTVSGPTMMTLADSAMYFLVLAHIGPVSLTVTTSLNINFLRKPRQEDLICDAKLLKLGKRLAIGDVTIYQEGESWPVAQATVTYSIPAQ
jgi:uncharacterized protein (TIGR00369 family)